MFWLAENEDIKYFKTKRKITKRKRKKKQKQKMEKIKKNLRSLYLI
jgi:hypothetical protein